MSITQSWIGFAGLLATIGAASYGVVQLHGQSAQAPSGNFTNAATAQVRDAQGQIVLQGTFAAPVEEDGELERRATLEPTGVDNDAAGDAEVEYASTGAVEQEVEFNVRNLPPNAMLTFVIDGIEVATATTDRRGRADVERDVPMASATR